MKNKRTILGVPLTIIILATALALVITATSPSGSWHTVFQGALAAGSTPDAYGDRIYETSLAQYIAGSWQTVVDIQYASYSSGTTYNIASGVNTYFQFICLMNVTKFPAPAGLGQLTLTIAGTPYTATPNTPVTTTTIGGQSYWIYIFAWTNGGAYWQAVASTTYNIIVTYRVYY
jgi:hypothetical protein